MKNRIVKQKLICKLTPIELEERKKELLENIKAKSVQEFEKSRVAKNFKTVIDGHEQENQRLTAVLESEEETRQVECEWEPQVLERRMHLYRLDTNERIDNRKMNDEEEQEYVHVQQSIEFPEYEEEQIKEDSTDDEISEEIPEDETELPHEEFKDDTFDSEGQNSFEEEQPDNE